MNPVAYARPQNLDEAMQLLSTENGAICIAGGTTVVDLMKECVLQPGLLVDIHHLPQSEISAESQGVLIGALARMSAVMEHPEISESFPVVTQALAASASPQLRNMATIGGNLLQRTRCVYFRDVETSCNKRDRGSGCAAIEGSNRQHAVLGTSAHCIATHPSDLAVALVLCDARVRIAGAGGEREIPLDDFYRLPGDTPDVENDLHRGEIITGVWLPRSELSAKSLYLKLRDRASFEFALVSVAAALKVERGVIADARLALGGVATKPWRATAAEDVLRGKTTGSAAFAEAAEAALAGAHGHGHNDFKISLAQRAIVRALETLATA